MVVYSSKSWETETRAELVSIGTHKLFVSTSGLKRWPCSPVVIYFTGGGAPVACHVRLQRLLSTVARVYFYDRSGYDRSELPPTPAPLAEHAASELTALLRAIDIGPPYVLVAHSYGGIIAREFLAAHGPVCEGGAVAGMVLADTATELMQQLYPHIPSLALLRVSANVDWEALTNLRKESRLSDEEWEAAKKAVQRSEKGAAAEDNRGSGRRLATKQQFTVQALGSQPLFVLGMNGARGYRLMYEQGVRQGDGTHQDRQDARHFIETWELFDVEVKTGPLRLSCCSKWQYTEHCGHDVPIRRPEIMVDAVSWILDRCSMKPI